MLSYIAQAGMGLALWPGTHASPGLDFPSAQMTGVSRPR